MATTEGMTPERVEGAVTGVSERECGRGVARNIYMEIGFGSQGGAAVLLGQQICPPVGGQQKKKNHVSGKKNSSTTGEKHRLMFSYTYVSLFYKSVLETKKK